MNVRGTREAFLRVVSKKGFSVESGINKTVVSLWKSGSRLPTIDKMEEILLKSGAMVASEKEWSINIKQPKQ